MKKRIQSSKDRRTESLLVYSRPFKSDRERVIAKFMINKWYASVLKATGNSMPYAKYS